LPLTVDGPMARTVADAALMLSVLAGPDPRSPLAIAEDGDRFTRPLGRDFKGTRVAWSRGLGLPFEPAVKDAMDRQQAVFESLGCVVEEAEPDLSGADEAFRAWRAWAFELQLAKDLEKHRDQLKDTVVWNVEEGARLTGPQLGRAEVLRTQAYHRVREFLERYEFLVLPGSQVPFPVGQTYVTEIDGVHPFYGLEVLFCCWHLVGQRFEVGVGGGRKRLNILRAYCPDDHAYLDRRSSDKNLTAQSLIELFTLMRARHPDTKYFRIYLDNARYHHANVLKAWMAAVQQERGVVFDLKHLPAYSPNLNLIERLWKFLRKKALQQWHPTFEDMQQAVAAVLDNLDRYKSELDSLMTERFQISPRVETVVVGVGRVA
jgi:hypothetical protein